MHFLGLVLVWEHSVQVATQRSCPEVPQNYSLHVHHGHYLEYHLISKTLSRNRTKKIKESIQDPAGMSFPRVQSSDDQTDGFGVVVKSVFLGSSGGWGVFVGDGQAGDRQSGSGGRSVEVNEVGMFPPELVGAVKEIGVGVGSAAGKVDILFRGIKIVLEGQAAGFLFGDKTFSMLFIKVSCSEGFPENNAVPFLPPLLPSRRIHCYF